MCIAIYKEAGKIISKESLLQCYKANPDGAGFLFNNGTELVIQKGFFTFDSFYEAYQPLEDKQMLIHFRIKTHGIVKEENCHPFFVNDELGFIHNGVITSHGSDPLLSDTRDFNEKILQPLVEEFGTTIINNPVMQRVLEDYIGWSKLVFMNVDGSYKIFNEHKGVWDNDVWYSNSSYKIPVYTPPVISKWNANTNGKSHHYSKSEWDAKRGPVTYYIEKSYNVKTQALDIIEEMDHAIVNKPIKGILENTRVKVMYITKWGTADVTLANGTLVQNIPSNFLDVEPFIDLVEVFDWATYTGAYNDI